MHKADAFWLAPPLQPYFLFLLFLISFFPSFLSPFTFYSCYSFFLSFPLPSFLSFFFLPLPPSLPSFLSCILGHTLEHLGFTPGSARRNYLWQAQWPYKIPRLEPRLTASVKHPIHYDFALAHSLILTWILNCKMMSTHCISGTLCIWNVTAISLFATLKRP